MKYDVIDMKGNVVDSIELDEMVFGRPYNGALIHQVIVAQLANKRQGTKCTLTRAEVRGTGSKPWKQKGSGRARHGSRKSPIWRTGGVAFAPKPRDYSKKVNSKVKAIALVSALSQKVRENNIIILDAIAVDEPKTKKVVEILKNINVESSALMVLQDGHQDVFRAGKNISKLGVINVNTINLYDIVKHEKLILTKAAIDTLVEVYA